MKTNLNLLITLIALAITLNCFSQNATVDITYYGAFGDDNIDDTESINNAINAVAEMGGGTVYFPQGTYMIKTIEPNKIYGGIKLKGKSNITLDMSTNPVLKAIPNSATHYSLLQIFGCSNIRILGGVFEGDRQAHIPDPYPADTVENQWGCGIIIGGGSDITLENVLVKECWGDGYVIGSKYYSPSVNIVLNNCIATGNRRNGLSTSNVDGLFINGGRFEYTGGEYPLLGTSPMAGIDIEAESSSCLLKNIVLENVKINNNSLRGIQIALGYLSNSTNTVSVNIIGGESVNDGGSGLRFCGGGYSGSIIGTVDITDYHITNLQSSKFDHWGPQSFTVKFDNCYHTNEYYTKKIINSVINDFDGDRISDIFFKTDNGNWKIDYSSNEFTGWDWVGQNYGDETEHPVPADYNGDGKADLSVKTDGGWWKIDYSYNGFTGWDWKRDKYGNATAHPVPADYNGDGMADLSVKADDGRWIIDYSYNDFTGWDWVGTNYGNATAHPVPADYNGDGMADLSVKVDDGRWIIDYSYNDFTGWDWVGTNYGNETAHPVPADYNGDGKADLSVKVDDKRWIIDYSYNDFTGWDWVGCDYGNQTAHPKPADYDGDGMADLSVKTEDGRWIIDYSLNEFTGWEWGHDYNEIFKSAYTLNGQDDRFTLTKVENYNNWKTCFIYDLNGKLINTIIQNITINEIKDYINLPSGIYILRTSNGNQTTTKKIYIY